MHQSLSIANIINVQQRVTYHIMYMLDSSGPADVTGSAKGMLATE